MKVIEKNNVIMKGDISNLDNLKRSFEKLLSDLFYCHRNVAKTTRNLEKRK